nr:hypothetical protein Iba_chr02eCG5280 [Ipomoea batatas]
MLIRLHHLLLSTTPSRQNSSLPEEMEAGRESSRTRVMAMLLLRRHRSSPLPPAAHARNRGEKKLLRHWKGRTPLPSSTAAVAQHCRRGWGRSHVAGVHLIKFVSTSPPAARRCHHRATPLSSPEKKRAPLAPFCSNIDTIGVVHVQAAIDA